MYHIYAYARGTPLVPPPPTPHSSGPIHVNKPTMKKSPAC